jgi:hypothetical protein
MQGCFKLLDGFVAAGFNSVGIASAGGAGKFRKLNRVWNTGGVESVLGRTEKIEAGIDHPRAGDLITVATENAWFTYYYWLDDARAPDFARTVDIHRKPGYDPVELFLDPKIPLPKLKIAWRLLQKQLGFRMLMDVVPLDASLVKGSHGRRPASTWQAERCRESSNIRR